MSLENGNADASLRRGRIRRGQTRSRDRTGEDPPPPRRGAQGAMDELGRYLWVMALLFSYLLTSCGVLASELRPGFHSRDATLFHEEGIVHRIDHGARTALINGLEYRFAADARVQINGTFGAWSMLLPEMKVDFIYFEDGPSRRTIVELHQLPSHAEIQGY